MKKVLLIAPLLSRSGYGEMARFALRSLLNDENIDLFCHNINWGKTGWIWKDDEERRMIDSLLQKTIMHQQSGGKFDASVQCTIPNEWRKLTPHDIGYTAGIEVDRVDPEWLVKGNEIDKIITISKHSAYVYQNSGYEATDNDTGKKIEKYTCKTPISYVGFPKKNVETEKLDINPRHNFNFLCVAQLSPRKNVDSVINLFVEEFKNDEVGLILKINGMDDSIGDYYKVKESFRELSDTIKREGFKCSINLLHGNLTDEQMQGLYNHRKVKAVVSFTHGEGFGLPLYEAACNGIPVIATNWSGHLDFLSVITPTGKSKKTKSKSMFAAVKYELKEIPEVAVWKGVLPQGSKWAYIDKKDAKAKMRDVFSNHAKWKRKANKLRVSIIESSDYYYNQFVKETGIFTDNNGE